MKMHMHVIGAPFLYFWNAYAHAGGDLSELQALAEAFDVSVASRLPLCPWASGCHCRTQTCSANLLNNYEQL